MGRKVIIAARLAAGSGKGYELLHPGGCQMLKIIALLMPALVWAAPTEPKTVVYKISNGRKLHVQISAPADSSKPTFLFLPGVNRSLLLSEPAAQTLIKAGYGVVGFNFSVQPFSLVTLDSRETPDFYNHDTTLQSLAEETEKLAQALKASHGLNHIIPVSLSYSGAVSLYVKGFAQIIDSVPMTSMDAFSPQLARYRRWLKSGELFNPIFGPGITRNLLDQAYRTHWVQQVEAITNQFNLPRERKHEMVDGYIRLSRATEGFQWNSRGDRTKRVFILAGKEAPGLQCDQFEVIVKRLEGGSQESVVIVMESGHVVPADQPEVYAQILVKAATGSLSAGLTVVTPSTKKWESLTVDKTLQVLRKALRDLPEASGGSSQSPGNGGFPGTL